jgi:hypothetical protein
MQSYYDYHNDNYDHDNYHNDDNYHYYNDD